MASSHPERPYLDLLERILARGTTEPNRTGTSSIALFGEQIRFPIEKSFPLLTTKKVFWKGIVEELLWFLKGHTNNKDLQTKGVRIWDGNSTRDALDARGLSEYGEGDCGPIYGFQWRHFGAEYKDCNTDYCNQGFDQIDYVINEIKQDPQSRRIMLSAWNPTAIDAMCLPPCHTNVQFHVRNGQFLSCHMYQRSCDTFLGLPFNIASYALLTYLIAAKTGLTPDELIISFGNVHIYTNHIDAVKTQLEREPMEWATIEIDDPSMWELDTLTFDNIHLKNYNSHPVIKAPMAL